jgi:hypothetical protein
MQLAGWGDRHFYASVRWMRFVKPLQSAYHSVLMRKHLHKTNSLRLDTGE